jgi:hypothetical protein
VGRAVSNLASKFNNFFFEVADFHVATCCFLFSLFSGHFCYFAEIVGNSTRHGCDMQQLPVITKVGPASGDSGSDSTGPIPFRIEVHTADGPMVLSLSQSAAAELAEQLGIYLRARGFQ